jgi:hypothetical protein
METGILKVPGVIWWTDGRFLFLKHEDYDFEVKIEALPEIIADYIHFKLIVVYPDLTKFETYEKIRKIFGFQTVITSGEKVIFIGEEVDLHIMCRTEKVVKYMDDGGCFIVYQPKFVLVSHPKRQLEV